MVVSSWTAWWDTNIDTICLLNLPLLFILPTIAKSPVKNAELFKVFTSLGWKVKRSNNWEEVHRLKAKAFFLLFLQKREEPWVRVGPYREHHKTEPVEYFLLLYTNTLNFSYRKPLSNLTMTRGPQTSSSSSLNYFLTN